MICSRRSYIHKIFTTFLIIDFELIAYIPIRYYFNLPTFIARFSPFNNLGASTDYIQNTIRLIIGVCNDLFGYNIVFIRVGLISIAVAIGILCWKQFKGLSFIFVWFTALSLLLAGVKGGQQGGHYVVILIPFVLLGLSQIANIFGAFYEKRSIIVVIALCSVVGITYGLVVDFYETFHRFGNMKQYENVATFIYDFNKNNYGTSLKNYKLSAGSPYSTADWESYGVWYFLERKYGKITSLAPVYGNVTELATNSNVYYQICFYYAPDRVYPDCLSEFEKRNPTYTRLRQIPYRNSSVSIFEYIKFQPTSQG